MSLINSNPFGKRKESENSENSFTISEHSFKLTQGVNMSLFKIIKCIGQGAYGRVYLVQHRKTKNLYAMKVLDLLAINKETQMARTLNERQMMVEVTHPFVVSLHYCFLNRNWLCFVLDFCQGGEMFAHCEDGLDESKVRFYAAQVTLALGHLHKQKIIYRDLKPENVMMCADGYIKLIDFGYCKFGIDSDNSTYSVCGTPEYYAPELLARSGYTLAVDWWTLGCFTYELCFGKCPFKHKDTKVLRKKIMEANVEFPESKNVGSKFKHFIVSLLTPEPKQRLGADGVEEVKTHQWFAKVKFAKLEEKAIEPPLIPRFDSKDDLRYFDTSYIDKKDKFLEEYTQDFRYSVDTDTQKVRDRLKDVYFNSHKDSIDEANLNSQIEQENQKYKAESVIQEISKDVDHMEEGIDNFSEYGEADTSLNSSNHTLFDLINATKVSKKGSSSKQSKRSKVSNAFEKFKIAIIGSSLASVSFLSSIDYSLYDVVVYNIDGDDGVNNTQVTQSDMVEVYMYKTDECYNMIQRFGVEHSESRIVHNFSYNFETEAYFLPEINLKKDILKTINCNVNEYPELNNSCNFVVKAYELSLDYSDEYMTYDIDGYYYDIVILGSLSDKMKNIFEKFKNKNDNQDLNKFSKYFVNNDLKERKIFKFYLSECPKMKFSKIMEFEMSKFDYIIINQDYMVTSTQNMNAEANEVFEDSKILASRYCKFKEAEPITYSDVQEIKEYFYSSRAWDKKAEFCFSSYNSLGMLQSSQCSISQIEAGKSCAEWLNLNYDQEVLPDINM